MKKVRTPKYSVLQMKDETFICKEDLHRDPNRFRRFNFEDDAAGYDHVAASSAVYELLENKGRVSVKVNEKTGIATIAVGTKKVEGVVSLLS